MKRRKGKRRPCTVPRDCEYTVYASGVPFCQIKLDGINPQSIFSCRACRNYGCNKKRDCGYTPKSRGIFFKET